MQRDPVDRPGGERVADLGQGQVTDGVVRVDEEDVLAAGHVEDLVAWSRRTAGVGGRPQHPAEAGVGASSRSSSSRMRTVSGSLLPSSATTISNCSRGRVEAITERRQLRNSARPLWTGMPTVINGVRTWSAGPAAARATTRVLPTAQTFPTSDPGPFPAAMPRAHGSLERLPTAVHTDVIRCLPGAWSPARGLRDPLSSCCGAPAGRRPTARPRRSAPPPAPPSRSTGR